jgi:hypothetical protein
VACLTSDALADRGGPPSPPPAPAPSSEQDQPDLDGKDEETPLVTRSGRASKPKKALSPPKEHPASKGKLTFRCTSRPSNLDMLMSAPSPTLDGPLAIGKFSMRLQAEGVSVFEVFAKTGPQSTDQVYRLFIATS